MIRTSRIGWDEDRIGFFGRNLAESGAESNFIRRLNAQMPHGYEAATTVSNQGEFARSDAQLVDVSSRRRRVQLLDIELEMATSQPSWVDSLDVMRPYWRRGLNVLGRKANNPSEIFIKYSSCGDSFFALDLAWFRSNLEEFAAYDEADSVSKQMRTCTTKYSISWNQIDALIEARLLVVDDIAALAGWLIEIASWNAAAGR